MRICPKYCCKLYSQ